MVPLQENTIISSTVFGGPEGDRITSLIQLDDGGFMLGGITASWGLGGANDEPFDFWLIRLDANLNILWNRTYGTNETEWISSLTPCSDGGYALVGFTQVKKNESYDVNVLLVRTDEDGHLLWNQTLGGPLADASSAMIQCDDGGFAITGYTYSYGAGESDAWLLRTDSTGTPLWNQTYGGLESDEAWDLVETDSGFILVGETLGLTDPDAYLICTNASGNLLWNRTYGDRTRDRFNRIIPVRSGGYLLSGGRGNLHTSIWFSRIDKNGDILWEKQVGLSGAEGSELIECQDGGFATVGSYSTDLYLTRTDTIGNTLWGREYRTGTLSERGSAILQLVDSSFLIAGYTYLTIDNVDAWLLRVTDIPILYFVIAQGLIAGLIVSFNILIVTLIILTYHFIKKSRASIEEHKF
jgi:hypothetical protein